MCEHCHSHEHHETQDKTRVYRLIIAFVIFAVAMIFHFAGFVKAAVFVIAYLIAGWDVLFKAKEYFKG